MTHNDFIFAPGIWLGEGKITLSTSPEFLKFYTKWEIKEQSPGVMIATQMVEMQEMEERMFNTFTFEDILPGSFKIILENNIVGAVIGKGIRDDHTIAWEFHNQSNFEGFEVYEKQENGDYFLHAEYGPSAQYRTTIEGLIWHKGS